MAVLVWARLIRAYGIPVPAGSLRFRVGYWFGLGLSAVVQAALLALLARWVVSLF